MHTVNRSVAFLLAVGPMFWTVGCGAKGDHGFLNDVVPATGRVTLNGEALPGATIRFVPAIGSAGGREAMAITDQSGGYEMSTLVPGLSPDESKGVVPGEYAVAISRVAMPDGAPPPADIIDENDAISKGAKQSVPAEYTDPGTSPLKVTVAAPKFENDFEF